LLATAMANGTVDVWSRETGAKRFTLPGHSGAVRLVPSPDGRQLVSADADQRLRLWDITSGKLLSECKPASSPIFGVACSPTNRMLATGHGDQMVRLWDLDSWKLIAELPGHSSRVDAVDFSPDGCRLVSVDLWGKMCLWDLQRRQPVLAVDLGLWESGRVSFSADGSAIAVTGWPHAVVLHSALNRSIRPGKSLSLLPHVDVTKDAIEGDWKREGDAIRRLVTTDALPRLVVPLTCDGSYVLRGEFTRVTSARRKTVGFILPAGAGRTMLCFDHEDRGASGLDFVRSVAVADPKDPSNPTNVKPGVLQDGRRYAMEARVMLDGEDVTIDVQLDGKPYIHWQGPQSALTVWHGWEVDRSGGAFGLATAECEVVFHRLELEMLDGEARLSREPSPKPPPGAKAAPAGEAIDLLKLVDPKVDGFDATVQITDGGVELSATRGMEPGRVIPPVWPHGNYELTGSFTLHDAAGWPAVIIPTTRSRGVIHWRFSHDSAEGCSAFESIDGKNVAHAENPTRVIPSKVQVGRRHAFRVRVLCERGNADLAVELDGQPYFRWKGPESAISLYPGYEVRHQRTLGIAVSVGRVTYHELTLRMLDGEAWLLRPPAH